MKKYHYKPYLILLCLFICLAWSGCDVQKQTDTLVPAETRQKEDADIPAYAGEPYAVLSGNKPSFTEADITTEPFESYSGLDELGRCGTAYANICKELMPTEPRGEIGMIKPAGWHTVKYEGIDGNYLYNRCHLIAFMLAGENDNEKNLITGTRYFNVEGMLPFENLVADYVKENDAHVLYRVTPVYQGENLLASGVIMEAYSVEDAGEGVCFCVYVYNVQPGIEIDYATGESRVADGKTTGVEQQESQSQQENQSQQEKQEKYILNQNTGKFHYPDCSSVSDIKPQNRAEFEGTREELIEQGYDPCGRCRP